MKFIKIKRGKVQEQFDEVFQKLELKHVAYQIRTVNHQYLRIGVRAFIFLEQQEDDP